ncbi:MAG TPA: HAMP domain-containing protein, partial [Anaerolineales bacterium]
MRSITLKLVFAFLAVSMVSVLLIVLLARYATGHEFQKFTEIDARSTLMISLEEYYIARGSWEGIETADLFVRLPAPGVSPPLGSYNPVTVTDPSGKVIRPGSGLKPGEVIQPNEFERAAPIKVNDRIVGYLVFAKPPFEENSPEKEFLNRTTLLLIYSALGATAVALLLGILLSRNLTSPIRELTLATHAVSQGDLSQQVRVRSRDELGELAGAFNKMSAELARSINARRQMTADIAHELRTPLSLILGHAEAVHDGVLPSSRENFEIIREEAGRLEHLVDELRTLSLADAGELPLSLQTVQPTRLLQDVATHFAIRLQKKGVALDLDLPASLPDLELDPGR